MCGIAGYFLKAPNKDGYLKIDVLLKSIRHRGPDDEGISLISRNDKSKKLYKTDVTLCTVCPSLDHINDRAAFISHDVALINTRYAIIDLLEGGHQPFVSRDDSIIAIFNGEIYNYVELKSKLSALGVQFRTSSDTEVLVEGYRIWRDEIWPQLNGFWAVVLYDFNSNSIVLSRDRLGIAPLYYRDMQDGFYFSSSIQSLLEIYPGDITLDNDIILGFIDTSMKDFDNSTCYSQIKTIPPATVVTFQQGQYKLREAIVNQYWDLPQSRLDVSDMTFDKAVTDFRNTFFNAVEIRLRADVNVAFELSGGLDSSSVVAVASILRNNDIRTYTIRAQDQNEEPYARSILEKYPIDFNVLSDPEETFPLDSHSFSAIMPEPYHSPNIYTHYKMRTIMKDKGVSVVLAGAGGDEVLCGYEGQLWPKAYVDLKKNGKLSHAIRYEIARGCRAFSRPKQSIGNILRRTQDSISHSLESYQFVHQMFVGKKNAINDSYNTLHKSRAAYYEDLYGKIPFHEQSRYHFKVAMLPYYLRSNDQFTMAIPLEHRFPFLDYRLVELGLQMPVEYLFKDGWTKYILRKAMEPYLPKKILWRRDKMGFPFPYTRFLSSNRSIFEPLLNNLGSTHALLGYCEQYELLLRSDPRKLWRILSIGLWLDSNGYKLERVS